MDAILAFFNHPVVRKDLKFKRTKLPFALLTDRCANRLKALGQRQVNHPPIDHLYKCHENTNHSRVPQLSKAPIPTSK